ncbi:MAG TPA: hypothetical protein DCL38_10300 [Lachnospiraceae bacterium]|nr:hypothetical protein [Lachnospiraceae bacterium]
MKIEAASPNVNQSLEKNSLSPESYNNYNRKELQRGGRTNAGGFMLDIGGMVTQTQAFLNDTELKSAGDLMSEAGNRNIVLEKNMMTVMSNTMSKEDYAEFAKNGYSISDMTVDEQVTSLDKLKASLARSGTVIEGYNDDLTDEQLSEITGNEGLANKIAQALKENDLPVNRENAESMVSAMEKASDIKPFNEETVKYMVINQLEPSVDNLYKAEFSSGGSTGDRGGYDQSRDHYRNNANAADWDELKGQAERIVKEAGLEADEKTMENARWLIEQGIPLTAGTISGINAVKSLELPLSEDVLASSMAIGIADGKKPSGASLVNAMTMTDRALKVLEDTEGIDERAVRDAVKKGEPLTIRNLAGASGEYESKPENTVTDVINDMSVPENREYLSAMRQLEETRLAMTYEANLKLLRQGISIETESLSGLVAKLKEAERDYYAPLLTGKGEEFESENVKNSILDERTGLYKQTMTVFEALRGAPAETLAIVDTESPDFTVRRVYEAAAPLKARYERAGSTYEALMTAPRSDLGDSIRKAFRNVDDILTDNGYELNDSNRRAVRILGYGGMEIDRDSIERVKEADLALRQAIERMTPLKTLEMIRNGDNPLDENIFSLRDRLSESDPTQDTERYSKFLVRLERRGEISEDEKDAFIGVYRLFRQIEKSDGKLLGNVLDSGEGLTLRNLLSASRSNRAKGMDYGIDDDFGGLERLITRGTSISEQIDRGFGSPSVPPGSQASFLSRSREILDKLSPESLPLNELNEDSTIEDIYDTVTERADTQVQTLIDDYQDDQAELLAAGKVEDDVLLLLSDNNIPATPGNILAQDVLMNKRGQTFNSLMKEAGGQDRASRRFKDAVSGLQEGLDSREEANAAYDELKEAADELLSERAEALTDSFSVRELGLLHKQVGIAAQSARNESYEVPVEIDGQWTSINLKLVRDGEESGTVTVSLQTEGLGKVGARFELNGRQISGYITGDSKEGLRKLSEKADELNERLTENGREIRQLGFIDTGFLDLNGFAGKPGKNDEAAAGQASAQRETNDSRELYEIAKGFISFIQRSFPGAQKEEK